MHRWRPIADRLSRAQVQVAYPLAGLDRAIDRGADGEVLEIRVEEGERPKSRHVGVPYCRLRLPFLQG